jgi:hypothetical protein
MDSSTVSRLCRPVHADMQAPPSSPFRAREVKGRAERGKAGSEIREAERGHGDYDAIRESGYGIKEVEKTVHFKRVNVERRKWMTLCLLLTLPSDFPYIDADGRLVDRRACTPRGECRWPK